MNVLWSWLAVAFSLVSGILLSPYVIHRLGDDRYGIWVLAFSFVDYFALVDFGFKSAVVKYAAHYRATGELERLDELIGTALAYFTLAGVIVFGAAVLLAWHISRLFHVLTPDESAFRFLTITVGVGCGLGAVFSACTAVLEAYQRFDISSRIVICNNAVRAIGTFTVVYAGLGLRAMGVCILTAQLIGYLLTYASVRRILPECSFSLRKARLSTLRRMFGYGSRTVIANVSLIVLNQDAPALIGHFLSTTFVGYYSFSARLIAYPVEMVGRLGMITGSKAAELTAHGQTEAIARMAIAVNRYCLMLFLIIPVYLSIFGRQLLYVWVNPNFAARSAPLLPIFSVGLVTAIAAQYNSTSILYGLAKHGSLARAVFLEAILSVAGLWYVIPRYGLFGAACVVSVLMIASRGLYVPYQVSCHLKIGYGHYLREIYTKPIAVMMPIAISAWLMNRFLGEPASWAVVLGAGAAMVICYFLVVFFYGLEREHRHMILSELTAARRRFAGVLDARAAAQP